MPADTTIRFPKLAAAVRKAIKQSGRPASAIIREAWPEGAAKTILQPLLQGRGRLHRDNRAGLERVLGLPATIWTLDGIPEGPYRGPQPRRNGAGPVGRALALAAAEPPAPAGRTPEVHEVGVVFRDGRAHVRVNVMVPEAAGLQIITALAGLGIIPQRSTEPA